MPARAFLVTPARLSPCFPPLFGVLLLVGGLFHSADGLRRFLNYVIAVYLLVGGATLLIEAFSMNDLKAD